ncbi:hypothetical protein MY11210_008991 [Beauveria gryllotalpidicola]
MFDSDITNRDVKGRRGPRRTAPHYLQFQVALTDVIPLESLPEPNSLVREREAERLEAELGPLETKRQNSRAAAREAKRRKEATLGGGGDDLEQRARWW